MNEIPYSAFHSRSTIQSDPGSDLLTWVIISMSWSYFSVCWVSFFCRTLFSDSRSSICCAWAASSFTADWTADSGGGGGGCVGVVRGGCRIGGGSTCSEESWDHKQQNRVHCLKSTIFLTCALITGSSLSSRLVISWWTRSTLSWLAFSLFCKAKVSWNLFSSDFFNSLSSSWTRDSSSLPSSYFSFHLSPWSSSSTSGGRLPSVYVTNEWIQFLISVHSLLNGFDWYNSVFLINFTIS